MFSSIRRIGLGILFLCLTFGCSKDSNKIYTVAGSYQVTGTIVNRAYPFWPNIGNDSPHYYTASFDTLIRIENISSDTFRIYGLGIINTDTQDGPNCNLPEYCGYFAIGNSDSATFIPQVEPGGQTYGGFKIIKDSIYLTYYHNYRNSLKTYSLAGQKN